jgi:multisubunit Na+/H+ antiporter MnhF subunit
MHPADLIKISKHPAVVWFDRISPVVCLLLAAYYAWAHSYTSAGVWLATAILGFVLSVCNITKIMQKLMTKIVARRGH